MTELPRMVRDRLREQASGRVELHPDADLLTAFCEHTLTPNERQQVIAHLALCADCRHAVALAVPPHTAEGQPGGSPHGSHGYGWAHWFALAASVVVVAAAVMQLPRSAPRGSELEVATRERAPAQSTAPQTEGEPGKLADQVTAVNGPAPAAPKLPEASARGYEFKVPGDDKSQLKRDQASSTIVGGDFRENKQQARMASQPAAAPARPPDLQTGPGGGPGKSISGGTVVGGLASSGAVGSGTARADAPAPPPPAVSDAQPVTAETVEENRRATEADKLKDGEAVKSELSAATRDEDRQRAVGESVNEVGQKEAAGKLAGSQEALDEKSRRETALAQNRYRQPEELPMKKHPAETDTTATKTEGSTFGAVARKLKAPLRWTVSSAGRVIRSLDGGRNWQPVSIAPEVRFRAIAVQDGTVWAGGDGGALFHSSDAGQTWTRRSLLARGLRALEVGPAAAAPTAPAPAQPAPGYDIVRIDITAGGRVSVSTSDRQSFISTDAGQTWSQQ